jgi:hypothetical protein
MTHHEQNGEDELQAARRTAYALGQTEGAEAAEVQAELAASPQATQEAEAVASLAARLKEAAQAVRQPVASPALREAIERRLTELQPVAGRAAAIDSAPRPSWQRWRIPLMTLATIATMVAFIFVLIGSLGTRMDREVALRTAPPTGTGTAPSRSATLPPPFYLNDNVDYAPPARMDINALKSEATEYADDSRRFEHKGAGTAKDMMLNPGPGVSGPGPGIILGRGAGGEGKGAGVVLTYEQARALGEAGIAKGYMDVTKGASDLNGYSQTVGGLSVVSGNGSPGFNFNNGGDLSNLGTVPAGGVYGQSLPAGINPAVMANMSPSRVGTGGTGLAGSLHDAMGDALAGQSATNGVLNINGSTLNLAGLNGAQSGSVTIGNNGALSLDSAPNGDGQSALLDQANKARLAGDEAKVKQLMERYDSLMAEGRHKIAEEQAALEGGKDGKPQSGERNSSIVASPTRRRTEHYPPQTKPVESWKPAHVAPNSSRLMVGEREELPLKGMQVDVRVDGFRARVLIDLYYFNDRPQQLEGNFQLRLPDEASPYFFAFGRTVYQAPQVTANDSMFFKPQQVSQGDTTPEKILALRGNSWEQPKVARMVPREKAALAYRDTVRRRVDPALVEWSGAGVFQCRVFPLAPQSLHRVTIGYDVDLTRVGDDQEMRLDLPGQAPATIIDLNIAASDPRQVTIGPLALGERGHADDATALTPGPSPFLPSTAGGRGERERLSYRLTDPKERPLVVRLRKPGMQMLVGNDEATGNFFATRVGLALPETPAADRAKQAIFLVDTSLSARPQFPLWTKLLRATLENNRDSIKEFAVLLFNVETFWWQEKFVANTPENVEAMMKYVDGLALEGATDLGRALKEAAAPKWQGRMGFSPSPDLFLLSDGAATWGEDRLPLLAAGITGRAGKPEVRQPFQADPGQSSQAGKPNVHTLFAYRTGLAGGDPRCLAYLAQQTGGAVFSLVGEAEIAAASVAHRNRPWRLTGIEMAGAQDLLVAGRPQYVFPGQQLLVVGRLEAKALTPGPSPNLLSTAGGRGENATLVFTLQQGKATQTIRVRPEQVLASELAARTFGQVATNQLEDVSGVAASAEPVATAYARHFRVTGRTCSLLMLESEQDYARFNIRPEEDSFVVKDRTAGPIVAKAVAAATAAMSDPKAQFLAWYRRVQQSSEVHFDLPAALNLAIEGLPAETFAVTPAPLVCKLRTRDDFGKDLRGLWRSDMQVDYEAVAAEAQRRLAACGADDAIKALSSLVEERPGDAALQRDLAFSAIEWQRPGEAYHLLRRAGAARTFEPITFQAMAHCLEQMGRSDLAIVYYELACGGQWDARFGDMHNIAQLDYLRFLRRAAGGRIKTSLADYARARLASLAGLGLRDTFDMAALIFWNTDGTDVDLHVIEPNGEECFYQHAQTASGGHISRDVTTGFGPELYLLPAAPAGTYRVSAHYFASDANRASTRTKVLALIYEGWGTKDERVTIKATALTGQKENHELLTVKR